LTDDIDPKTAGEAITRLATLVETGDIDPSLLKVAPTNNRKTPISDTEKEEMKRSILTSGVIEPIIINEDNLVVSGQLRWAGALSAGLKKIPFIRMKFNDRFSERVVSLVQDYFHHDLTASDRGWFAKRAVEEDHKTTKFIAETLGLEEETVKNWLRALDIPKVLDKMPKSKQQFLSSSHKKRLATKAILESPEFREDPNKAVKLVEFSSKAPLREIESIRKDVTKHTPIDIESRTKRLEGFNTLIEVKVPRYLEYEFRKQLLKRHEDFVNVLIFLMEKYVRGECLPPA
jgi:ParB family chromosome partitioning protein